MLDISELHNQLWFYSCIRVIVHVVLKKFYLQYFCSIICNIYIYIYKLNAKIAICEACYVDHIALTGQNDRWREARILRPKQKATCAAILGR